MLLKAADPAGVFGIDNLSEINSKPILTFLNESLQFGKFLRFFCYLPAASHSLFDIEIDKIVNKDKDKLIKIIMLIKSKKYQCNPSTFLFSFIVSHKDLKSSKCHAATLIFRKPLATQKTKLKKTPENIANVLEKKNR